GRARHVTRLRADIRPGRDRAGRRGAHDPWAVRAAGSGRGPAASARGGPARSRPVRRLARELRHWAVGRLHGPAPARSPLCARAAPELPRARRDRPGLRGPDLPRPGHRRRPERRPSRGHRPEPHRPLADRNPRVCERGHRARGVRRPAGVVPHHRPAAPRSRAGGAHSRPPPAIDPPHARLVRLYRADGAGGHGRGDGVGLHQDGGAEGAAAPVCDRASRPAQRALADDHGHRLAGGLAGRRTGGGGDPLHLSRTGQADLRFGGGTRCAGARGDGAAGRRDLHAVQPDRGPAGGAAQSADPVFGLMDAAPPRVGGRPVLGRLIRSAAVLAGGAVVVFWVFAALEWRVITPYDPFAVGPAHPLASPSRVHWLGTDDLGRDVLSRVLAGAASVLTIAPAATLLSLLGGTTIGLVAGFHRGLLDDVLMRLVDAVM